MKTRPVSDMSDEQLIKDYLRGDNVILGVLYSRYYQKVYQKCLSYTGNQDDAFDLAQDVLMKAFSNIESFRGSSKFSTWLYSITQNHCISQKSKSMREKKLGKDITINLISEDLDEEEQQARIYREDLELKIDKFLHLLPANDRRMLELKYLSNYSVQDLQIEFNLTASAVKMRLFRARQKMEGLISQVNAA